MRGVKSVEKTEDGGWMDMFAFREDELGESRGVEELGKAIHVLLELLHQL
jgi:hypothetical protein